MKKFPLVTILKRVGTGNRTADMTEGPGVNIECHLVYSQIKIKFYQKS